MDKTLVRILIVGVLLAVANAAATLFIVSVVQRQIDSTRHQEQLQGQILDRKLCGTFELFEHTKAAPVPNAARNHDILAQLGPDLGCKG